MTMADKIVVLDLGAISQVGAPLDLYNRPANLFVARFIGSPTMNVVKGEWAARRGADVIGIRPEHTEISTTAGEWPGKVRVAEHLGSETFVYVDVDGIGQFTVRIDGEAPIHSNDRVFLSPREPRLHKFSVTGERIAS